jgi:hypothetical protein
MLSGIAIDVGAELSADAKLKLAARRESVQVHTTAPAVQTDVRAGIAQAPGGSGKKDGPVGVDHRDAPARRGNELTCQRRESRRDSFNPDPRCADCSFPESSQRCAGGRGRIQTPSSIAQPVKRRTAFVRHLPWRSEAHRPYPNQPVASD